MTKPQVTIFEAIHQAGLERLRRDCDVQIAYGASRSEIIERTRASDIAQLPDGSVLVLNRALDLLRLGYRAQIVRLDPAAIRPGRLWQGQVVATLSAPLPVDNMEGLAIEAQADGSAVIWLVSDDNRAAFQRNLLMKLRWREERPHRFRHAAK